MDEGNQLRTLARIAQAFSPGAPVDRYALFAGRAEHILEVLAAVNQRGQHVVLFGERGVGKTSLANILTEVSAEVGQPGVQAVSVNCDGSDRFATLWKKIFREIVIRLENGRTPGFSGEQQERAVTLDKLLPDSPSPEDVRYVFERLGSRVIVIVDELDRIEDSPTTTLIADTVKTLSDHSTDATLVLVGVADSVDDLIHEHASVERALVQVRMPRMSHEELGEIIDKGLAAAEMSIDAEATDEIVALSQGLPHYTHLLALHSAQVAVNADRTRIALDDVDEAIGRAVQKAQQSIVSAYHAATSSPRKDSLFEQVLLACAMAKADDLGYFAAADVREPLSRIMGKPYDIPAYSRHLNDFSDTRGPVLQKTGSPRRYRFRFINPMMQPFILMRGRDKGLLPRKER